MTPTSTPGHLDLFQAERARLTGLAYRITGSLVDAEDTVQEAWMRWAAQDVATFDNPAGWLTTVTTRLALDRLRAQRRRREVYVGPWLPDPAATVPSAEDAVQLGASLTLGFLVLLDALGPSERAAFLLADVFGEPYPVVAEILDKTVPACRQLVARARRKVRSARPDGADPRPAPAPAELLTQLITSVLSDDEDAAMRLLHPDVVLVSDAGAARRAARHPVVGAERVRRLLKGGWRLFGFTARPTPDNLPPARLVEINASPSLVMDTAGGPIVITADAIDGRISSIWVRLNPAKTAVLHDPPTII
ncbi:sigma-70 family RNA polymerase sigma factor [Acidiferrimicrobium sp. IK]|uniref:sigma-70 family RNA polymerase sigma factor n=1 Tax=Acidiferrimicrobium sp. IK TaxID=2871700 RepID=UPI0021CB5EEF|nr:sigma-70 family RNA polymerase sigma factor [Acidiferrimicrobium sp. IK]MCU4184596.1 sigma-70 family RNA polymerase sigma factor [Acidiferrimicrobium sp. IK]